MPETTIPQGVREVADHYSKATGIPCSVLDVLQERLADEPCGFCQLLEVSDSVWRQRCLQSHLHNARLSERFGGSYIYFCPSSLLNWVSPVIMNGKMEYAIIAGPVLVFEPAELADDPVFDTPAFKRELEKALETIPRIDVARAHNLSEVLRMCAGWASGYAEHRMVESRNTLQIQSRLSEYIQNLKEEDPADSDRLRYYPLEKEERLQEAIRWGDRQTAQKIMNELLGQIFFVHGNTLDRVNFRVMELILLLSRAAVQGGAPEEEIMEISYRCQREIGHYSSLEGMAQWLSRILHQYTDLVFASKDAEYGTMIAQAIQYIRKHYQDRITLENTARAVALSPNYFSRVFNAKMHVSFSSYVNRLRVEKAERLLLNTRLSLVEIAGVVGFEDQSYFSKVFKSVTTLTPGHYRKNAGRFPTENQEIHDNKPSES